jgi:guanylate kinase
MVGNKLDLIQHDPSQRKIKRDDALEYAQYEGITYYETSALTAKNVDKSFFKLLT